MTINQVGAGSYCSVDEVKIIAQISPNADITDGEIASSIIDVSETLRAEFGDPLDRTYTYINYSSTGSTYYDFTGNNEPVYKVVEVQVDNRLVNGSSYTGSLDVGYLDFDTAFLSDEDSNRLDFIYVPKIYNLLAKNMAALEIIEASRIMDGRSIEMPLHKKIRTRVDMYYDIIRPKGLFRSEAMKNYDPQGSGRYIEQRQWYVS